MNYLPQQPSFILFEQCLCIAFNIIMNTLNTDIFLNVQKFIISSKRFASYLLTIFTQLKNVKKKKKKKKKKNKALVPLHFICLFVCLFFFPAKAHQITLTTTD